MKEWSVIVIALIVGVISVRFLTHDRKFFYIPDVPNERSLHHRVVSRTGGIGIFMAIWSSLAIGLYLGADLKHAVLFLVIATPVLGVSLIDDYWQLPVLARLLVHLLAAAAFFFYYPLSGVTILPGIYLTESTLLWIFGVGGMVWLTNLYNFMDGMDGLAGGMGFFGFGTLAVLGYLGGNVEYAMFCGVMSASALGFLVFNFPPAKIFMGDVGSSGYGFLAGAVAIWGDVSGVVALWKAALLFSPFIVDATITLVRRVLTGKRVWQAHRSHFYQRAVQSGFTHRRVLMSEITIMVFLGVTVIGLRYVYDVVIEWIVCAVWISIYFLLAHIVNSLERKKSVNVLPG